MSKTGWFGEAQRHRLAGIKGAKYGKRRKEYYSGNELHRFMGKEAHGRMDKDQVMAEIDDKAVHDVFKRHNRVDFAGYDIETTPSGKKVRVAQFKNKKGDVQVEIGSKYDSKFRYLHASQRPAPAYAERKDSVLYQNVRGKKTVITAPRVRALNY